MLDKNSTKTTATPIVTTGSNANPNAATPVASTTTTYPANQAYTTPTTTGYTTQNANYVNYASTQNPASVHQVTEQSEVPHVPGELPAQAHIIEKERYPEKHRVNSVEKIKEKVREWTGPTGRSHLILLVVSFILLYQASRDLSDAEDIDDTPGLNVARNWIAGYGFAIFVGSLSFIMTLLHLIAIRKQMATSAVSFFFAFAIFVLWSVAVLVLTFGVAYNELGNGYFASWAGFILAFLLLSEHTHTISDAKYKFERLGWKTGLLLVASIILTGAASGNCADDQVLCRGEHLFPLVWGVISIVFAIGLFFVIDKIPRNVGIGVMLANSILWFAVVICCTFDGPFVQVGNGYFASWTGLIASIILLQKIYHRQHIRVIKKNPATDTKHAAV